MNVLFKCRCMLAEAVVEVPDREPAEDIAAWMQKVQAAIGAFHGVVSPGCGSAIADYVKIPLPDQSAGIGYPVKH